MKRLIFPLVIALLVISNTGPLFAEDGSARGEIKPTPWSSDWWSRQKGFLIKGWPGHSPSAFERYDQYVMSRTGRNPGVLAWESDTRNQHYNPKAQQWEGHCNGWAASSMLTPEPRIQRTRNGIVFDTSDQKGILCEQYMNTYCMFFGKRYWSNKDDMDDIYPDQFHQLLLEYIGTGKSAMIVDASCDEQVWNYPIYKFESNWSSGWLSENKLKVKTTCYFADDNVRPDFVGTKWFSVTYTYNLFTDDNGNITGGEWTGQSSDTHPDFVWVPTADAPNPSGTVQENPNIDPRFVNEIVTGPASLDTRNGPAVPSSPNAVVMEAGLDPNELF